LSLFERNLDAIVLEDNVNRRFEEMHPATSKITMSAHIRDLQRAMHPERSKSPRRPLAWIRKSR
jgi:hypothetical protein